MKEIERVHVAMGRAWPGLARERLGDWLLRFGDGYTSRANSALPVGDPGLPLDDAVDSVERAYRARGLAPCFQIPLMTSAGDPGGGEGARAADRSGAATGIDADPQPPAGGTIDTGARPVPGPLDALLAERGYRWEKPTLVETLAPGGEAAAPAPDVTADWSDAPSDGWISLASARFRDNPAALAVTTAHPARYLTLWSAGNPIGRGRVAAAGEWFDISDLLVVAERRGSGIGRWAMTELTRAGRELGARHGVLQVEAVNEPARRLYRSLGWSTLGGYHYRTLAA